MIVTLDLAKTYGQQNTDISKKDKINKININVNLQSDSDDTSSSESSSQVDYGPINIEQNYVNEENYYNLIWVKNVQSKMRQDGLIYNLGLWTGEVTGTSSKFPICKSEIYYKTYNISINLNNSEYEKLKYIKSQVPFTFNFIEHLNEAAFFASSPAGLACNPVSFFKITFSFTITASLIAAIFFVFLNLSLTMFLGSSTFFSTCVLCMKCMKASSKFSSAMSFKTILNLFALGSGSL